MNEFGATIVVSGGGKPSVSVATEPAPGAQVTRPLTIWAGLRSLAAGHRPVRARAPRQPDVVWYASQDGCRTKIAPTMSRLAANRASSHTPDLTGAPVASFGRGAFR